MALLTKVYPTTFFVKIIQRYKEKHTYEVNDTVIKCPKF